MATPVLSGADASQSAVDGMAAMTSVLDGYLKGEQTNRNRFVEDRQYNEGVRQFDETTRRFDVSYEEQVREFDDNMDYNVTQNELQREQQRFLQDDSQNFMGEQALLDREQQTREHNKDLGYQYHVNKELVKSQNEDRALQNKAYYVDEIQRALGPYKNYDEIPDKKIVGLDNTTVYLPDQIIAINELSNIVNGRGSNVYKIDRNKAIEIGNQYTTGKITEDQLSEMLLPYAQVQNNKGKQDAVTQMMLWRVGGDPDVLYSMPDAEFNSLHAGVIYDMNNHPAQRAQLQSEQLDFYRQQRLADTGASYGAGGTNSDGTTGGYNKTAAQVNGATWYSMGEQAGDLPGYTGNNQAVQNAAAKVQVQAKALRDFQTIVDDDERERKTASQLAAMSQEAQTMKANGVSGPDADWYLKTWQDQALGLAPVDWSAAPKPKRMATTPSGTAPGTAQGAVRGQPAPRTPGEEALIQKAELQKKAIAARKAFNENQPAAEFTRQRDLKALEVAAEMPWLSDEEAKAEANKRMVGFETPQPGSVGSLLTGG